MEKTKIAILGLGLMGGGMARRLLDAGYPLAVYNRTRSKAEPLIQYGALVAATPAEAVSGADVIFTMVSDDDASREIWLGETGALSGVKSGAIMVESSTVTPSYILELDKAVRDKGLTLIDAPVTGSKPQAAAGQLLFLAGGPKEALTTITPLLRAMGRDVVHLGPTGSGARMKLINNFLSGVQAASLGEALGLIERSGLDVDQALNVLTEGAPGSPMIKTITVRMVSRSYEPNFAAKLMAKDLRYAVKFAREMSQDLPTAAGALHDYEAAIAAGRGEEDLSVVVEQFRQTKASQD
jgi:3-hydroxyisobutyrate dehydrogenase